MGDDISVIKEVINIIPRKSEALLNISIASKGLSTTALRRQGYLPVILLGYLDKTVSNRFCEEIRAATIKIGNISAGGRNIREFRMTLFLRLLWTREANSADRG